MVPPHLPDKTGDMAPQHDQRSTDEAPDDDVEAGRRLFDRIRRTGLVRPDEGWFGGVAALVADRLRWDAALVRGIVVVLAIITFPPVALVYGLAWILLPDGEGRIHLQQGVRGSFSSGLIGGGVLALIGALGLLSPFNLTGVVGIVLNVLVLITLIWLVVIAVRRARRRTNPHRSHHHDAPEVKDAGRPTGDRSSGRADGKPAWYPMSSAASTTPRRTDSQPAQAATKPLRTTTKPTRSAKPALSPAEREARRRRRQLTTGAVLLTLPVLLGLALLGGAMGFSNYAVLLAALTVVVLLMSGAHIIAALRGRRGGSVLLGTLTVVMLLLFVLTQTEMRPGDASHAFDSYSTDDDAVGSALSSTSVDLRHLDPREAVVVDGVEVHTAELHNAFGTMDVIVPDDVEVVLDVNQDFGSLSTHSVHGGQESSGTRNDGLVMGPEEAEERLVLSVDAAFDSLDIYDATTYAEEFGSDADSGEGR